MEKITFHVSLHNLVNYFVTYISKSMLMNASPDHQLVGSLCPGPLRWCLLTFHFRRLLDKHLGRLI
jgi:hypothetical protein